MVTLGMLWLPIVASAVVAFFASFLMWMALPHHRSDWGKLQGEDAVLAAMREQKVTTERSPAAPSGSAARGAASARRSSTASSTGC